MTDDRRIPPAALGLGLAGVLPFAWGVLTIYWPRAETLTIETVGLRFVGPFVSLDYGVVILCFMSGVLWGFATRMDRGQGAGYALSVVPALWAFFMVQQSAGPVSGALNLIVGFVGLLALDFTFWQNGHAPRWWMKLRLLLTALVVACLLPIGLA